MGGSEREGEREREIERERAENLFVSVSILAASQVTTLALMRRSLPVNQGGRPKWLNN